MSFVTPDGGPGFGTSFMMLLPMIIMLLFYAFIIYSIVYAMLFMKKKIKLDAERNQKLDVLIEITAKREEKQPPGRQD